MTFRNLHETAVTNFNFISQSHGGWAEWIPTAVLALFTFGLVIVSLWTLLAARRSSEMQLRAYISAIPSDTHISNFDKGIKIQIALTIKNDGKTPALDITYAGMIDILPFPLLECSPQTKLQTSLSRYNLTPGDSFIAKQMTTRLFSQDEILKATNNNGLRVYVFGTIVYTDMFKKTRTTKFCRSLTGCENLQFPTGQNASIAFNPFWKITAFNNEIT